MRARAVGIAVAVGAGALATGFVGAGRATGADQRSAPATTRPAPARAAPTDTIVLFDAGSLARPLKALLDSFSTRTGAVVQQEHAGSLETARKLTDLGRIPDVIALADYEVFPRLLIPSQTSWYITFARNRMVLAYTDRSASASAITAANWWQITTQPGVQVGRSDPNLDPAGYRTLLVFQLAERAYARPGLAAALLAGAPPRNMRPKSVELTGLLQTGDLDYGWEYESAAREAGLRFLRLPPRIDLGDPADSAFYAQASVRVMGNSPSDTIEFRGEPILFALSIPARAPHPAVAERFVTFLFSDAGKRILRAEHLDILDRPVLAGSDVPPAVARAVAK